MKSKKVRTIGILILLILIAAFVFLPHRESQNYKSKYENAGDLNTDV